MRILAPNTKYTGVSASVAFRDGVGETADPNLIEWFRDHGYTVEQPAPEMEATAPEVPPDQLAETAHAPMSKTDKPKRPRKGEAK